MSGTAEKMLRGVVLAAVFALPFLALYVANSMFFPFISGKNFAFRIFIEIAACAWIGLAFLNPAYRPKRSMLLWGFTAFVAIIGVADLFGVYPFKSFWSNFERMEGWVALAHLFAYFVIAVSVLNTEKLWRTWWHTSLAVSFIVACTGIFQLLGWVPINQSGSRLDARLGNSTYLGVYMLFHIFMAALLLARVWIQDPRNRPIALWFYGGLIALNSFVLFFSATRGAMFGLIGGAMLAGLIGIVQNPRSRAGRYTGVALAGLVVCAGIFWMVRDAEWVDRIEPLHRLATIAEDGTTVSRFMNWGMAWEGAKERPILGWGQENYAAVFDKYYNPNMWGQEPWFDRTHNIIFDWLIAGGFLGLFAYLSLYVFALAMVWRSGAFAPYERALFIGLFAGYFFYLLFTFDNLTSYILFVSVLAYIAVRASADRQPLLSYISLSRAAAPAAVGAAAILAISLVWFVNADAIRQNRALIQAIQPQEGGVERNLELFKEAASYKSVGTQEVREQFSQAAMQVAGLAELPAETKQEFIQAAITEFQKQVDDAPLHARAPFFLGVLLDRAGAYDEAKTVLEEAHRRSPRKQAILFELGSNAQARGDMEGALSFLKEAYESAPEYPEAGQAYTAALILAGKNSEAESLLQQLVEQGIAATSRIANALAARGRFDTIVTIWRAHVEKNPQDIQARFLLAAAYYEGGNAAAAIRELEAAKEAVPSAATQANELIEQVRGGL